MDEVGQFFSLDIQRILVLLVVGAVGIRFAALSMKPSAVQHTILEDGACEGSGALKI